MKKIVQKTFLSLIALSAIESALALDSGTQNLTAIEGATDYFKINCAGDTDHLNFKLFEGVANNSVVETPAIPPQLFNAKLTKLKLTSTVSAIEAGTTKEITLKGGNGAYTLTLDTFGTNLSVKTAQTYAVQYQCLNTKGNVTKGSSTLTKSGIESVKKTLANNKTAKYSITCAKDAKNGNTSSLVVKLINKTAIIKPATSSSSTQAMLSAPSGDLTAQVIKAATAKNTTGVAIDIQNGSGNYDVLVNSPTNKALPYHFEYSCLNTKNVEAKTSPFQLLQDQ
ncbi:MAG: hypothetical protein PHC99_10935 [Methylococcales bacterium]|nr:hypothetical protein [Methylococcales bacterium]